MQRLLDTLDDEVRVLEALVRATQKEQQHLLAFEPEGLDVVVDEKRRLLARADRVRTLREALVNSALTEYAYPASEEPTLLALIERAPLTASRPIATRRARIRALLAALSELNAVSGYHAERQLRWVQTCRRSVAAGKNGGEYTQAGRRERPRGGGLVVNASV